MTNALSKFPKDFKWKNVILFLVHKCRNLENILIFFLERRENKGTGKGIKCLRDMRNNRHDYCINLICEEERKNGRKKGRKFF